VFEKFVENLYGLGSGCGAGSGSSRSKKSDLDPDKNRPDPQHCLVVLSFVLYLNPSVVPLAISLVQYLWLTENFILYMRNKSSTSSILFAICNRWYISSVLNSLFAMSAVSAVLSTVFATIVVPYIQCLLIWRIFVRGVLTQLWHPTWPPTPGAASDFLGTSSTINALQGTTSQESWEWEAIDHQVKAI
jgi:hypothetical protein